MPSIDLGAYVLKISDMGLGKQLQMGASSMAGGGIGSFCYSGNSSTMLGTSGSMAAMQGGASSVGGHVGSVVSRFFSKNSLILEFCSHIKVMLDGVFIIVILDSDTHHFHKARTN